MTKIPPNDWDWTEANQIIERGFMLSTFYFIQVDLEKRQKIFLTIAKVYVYICEEIRNRERTELRFLTFSKLINYLNEIEEKDQQKERRLAIKHEN